MLFWCITNRNDFYFIPYSFYISVFINFLKKNKGSQFIIIEQKICLFIPNAEGGGAEKIFINLANFLNQEKYEVNLVLSNKNGKYLNLINDSIKVFDLKSKKISFSIIPLILYLRSEKPDYVFSALNHANVICSLSIL